MFGHATPALARQSVPPDETYRTLHTAHFRITFPEQLGSLAPKAAARAERAYGELTARFLAPPAGAIDILLTDHTDLANGITNVFPSNRITIWVQPPLEGFALSEFDDHLDLVISHELTHTFHLDRTGPLGRAVRSVLGRVPWTWPAYPGYTVAPLGIEGVAVWQETLQTGAGRLNGSFFEAIVRTQALEGRPETVGQGLGDSPVWPGGDRPYVLGSLFFQYLADTYGEEAVPRFLEAMADQWVPYRLDAAANAVFGRSFGELWSEWVRGVEAQADSLGEARAFTTPELVTEGGRRALYPAPAPDGRAVAYVRADGRSDVRLVVITPEGERTLSRWNSLDPPAWLPDGSLLVPQLDYVDTYRFYRDLYRVTEQGEVQRLTHGLRVVHADPRPGSSDIVAVVAGEAGNRLVLLSADGDVVRTLRDEEPDVFWSHPAWSPEGERIAVARHRPGAWTAIAILDDEGNELARIVEDRSLNTAPTWTPGGEEVIWSSDRTGVPNLYASRVPLDSGSAGGSAVPGLDLAAPPIRQITHLSTAGSFPAVDPAGRWIYLSVLSDDGWEIARIPLDRGSWFEPLPGDPRYTAEPGAGDAAADPSGPDGADAAAFAPPQSQAEPYSAIQTLLPRYWIPVRIRPESVFGTEVLPNAWGARTSGHDLVNRHEYELGVATSFGARRARTEWDGSYRWSGLGNPVIALENGQEWASGSPLVASSDDAGPEVAADTLLSAIRERWIGGAVELRRRRSRSGVLLTLGGRVISEDRRLLDLDGTGTDRYRLLRPESTLAEGRISLSLSTARGYSFSVSTEEGVRVSLGLRQRWDLSVPDSLAGVPGGDRAFREAVVSLSAFKGIGGPGYANHVLAVRAAAGIAGGTGAGSGHFGVGGGGGDGRGILGFTLGTGFRRFPVRGAPTGAEWGSKAWSLTGEWRFPVAMVHRGAGAWPLYVDRIAGSVFVDAAGAERDGASGDTWHTVSSVGAEVIVFHSLLFEAVESVRAGIAFPLEIAPGSSGGPSVYVQTGWSF